MEERIKIYSYRKVWKVERKIYAIGNIVLPFAVNPNDALSFVGALVVVMIVIKIIPPLAVMPAVIQYFILPIFLAKYLMKKKLDGKNPVLYLAGIIGYWMTEANTYIEGFRRYRNKEQIIKQYWRCSWRRDSEYVKQQRREEKQCRVNVL